MAGGTRDIKRKIRSVNSTMQITKAMELVSTAKLKRARDRMDITKPYFDIVQKTVRDILKSDKNMRSRYIQKEPMKKPLVIVVTSDRGLCGGYNANAIKKALHAGEKYDDPRYIVIGKKALDALNRTKLEIVDQFLYISEKPEFIHASQLAEVAMSLFHSGEVDGIEFIYTRFVSTISQQATSLQLLPISVEDEDEEASGEEEAFEFMNYEPSPEAVLKFIVPKYVESTIFGGLIESSASEQAARRIAMESATDNAQDIIEELVLSYNQARQAAITQEISEIVGGAEALK